MPNRFLRPIQVVTGRHPFEVMTLAAAALAGVTLLTMQLSPRSVASALHPVVQQIWTYELLIGGVVGLTGVFWPGTLYASLKLESIGVFVLAAATTMYTIALVTVSGSQAITAGSFIGAIAVASWARVAQIVRDIGRATKAARTGTTAEVTLLAEEK
ncbi:hypothetical protein AMIS_20660 [Actinoplanes missouriensis 431]|uniref:Integral membrane protein n=1 Tax=Actinoplanes missouriensis (strain ATCC 14538 / DSM 43046 / CBS 188.64 / JCM 3121 / NBRC 102363 / NCIMB 12654 / NRRL B-3342 / UNCC 431) TaxID=512565 RepID=I0H2P9_ACTM4|nr:hypothetical protein [Actinoplanes missouriensis]BAL87286.1 hypothetical protein AMIS_20660 [Actinoplanes missouriensis 431]